MFIVMRETVATAIAPYLARTIYDVDDAIGEEWTRKGLADVSLEPPAYVSDLYTRLESDGKPTLFLSFVGEFGHEIMSHIRIVHFSNAPEKVVCCRPGHEVLYPSATEFVTDWSDPINDAARVGTLREVAHEWPEIIARYPDHQISQGASRLTPEQEIFPIRPDTRIPFKPAHQGLKVDIVFGVSRRAFAPERNWNHWRTLADAATAAGLTFAVIGHRSTSFDLYGQQFHTGDMGTAATIELLQNCQLYVGTDSGASHLASTVGCPMLVFREIAGGSRDLLPRMELINPGNVETVHGGWNQPQRVITRMLAKETAGKREVA